MLHNLSLFSQNAIYFIILSFSVQIRFFINQELKFKYQPGRVKVRRDISRIICNTKGYRRVRRNPLLITALNQTNPVHALSSTFVSWINHYHRHSGNLLSFCYTVSCALEINTTNIYTVRARLVTFFYMQIVVWNKMSTLCRLWNDQLPPHLQGAFALWFGLELFCFLRN
jgi:hypothetical protein